jgi:hypothetical protein
MVRRVPARSSSTRRSASATAIERVKSSSVSACSPSHACLAERSSSSATFTPGRRLRHGSPPSSAVLMHSASGGRPRSGRDLQPASTGQTAPAGGTDGVSRRRHDHVPTAAFGWRGWRRPGLAPADEPNDAGNERQAGPGSRLPGHRLWLKGRRPRTHAPASAGIVPGFLLPPLSSAWLVPGFQLLPLSPARPGTGHPRQNPGRPEPGPRLAVPPRLVPRCWPDQGSRAGRTRWSASRGLYRQAGQVRARPSGAMRPRVGQGRLGA